MTKEDIEDAIALWLGLIMLPVSVLVNAWALWLLWGWFVTPSVDITIGFWQAGGLMVLLDFLRLSTKETLKSYYDKKYSRVQRISAVASINLITIPLLVLVAYIVQLLM